MLFGVRTLSDWTYCIAGIALVVGLILTGVSYIEMCSSSCNEVHQYRLYGIPFEAIGFLFFPSMGALHFSARRLPLAGVIVATGLAMAVGAETSFILAQKYIIEQWCPICLSIAACVGIAAAAYLVEGLYQSIADAEVDEGGEIMHLIKRSCFASLAVILGFSFSLMGIAGPEEPSFVDGLAGSDPSLGNPSSHVEVYVITDWFCPSCQRIEPKIERIYSRTKNKARFYFIDLPIHSESMNFTPYNISFMIHNKANYFKARRALHHLAEVTRTPTQRQVQQAVSKEKIIYHPLNYADINNGTRFFNNIAEQFDVNRTPTVIVTDRDHLKAKTLVGTEQITEAKIMKAIREAEG